MGSAGYAALRFEVESCRTQLIQREVVQINMACSLETSPIVPEIMPRRVSETQQELFICARQRQTGMALDARKVDIKAAGSKVLSDGRQFRTASPNSQSHTAYSCRRKQRLQCNQESILLLKRVSEQCAPESQVGIHDSEARAAEDSFFCADDSCKLIPVANSNNSRRPTFGHRSQEELGIEHDIVLQQ